MGSSISVAAVIVGSLLKAEHSVGLAIGLFNGLLASHTKAHPIIPTLGTMTLWQGVAIIITEGYPITDLGKKFEFIGSALVWKVQFIVILFFSVLLVGFFILKYTRLGRTAFVIGGNEYTTYLVGLNVKRYKVIFRVMCGFLTGLAALVLASRISSVIPTMGSGFELQLIAAAVIGGIPFVGGRGSVWGTLTGVLLLGIIANGLNLLHVETSWQYVVTDAVIIHEHRMK